MAWQLHYTSAAAGPSGRAGFQIVAESPGLPAGVAGRVTPYLTYRSPPSTPTAPSPERIRAMPVALSYGPAGDRFALVRCVYLGRDYSGRYGNFLGHALVLADGDLVGLRPIEFWRAPLWADEPSPPGAELPELADLMPGAALDPESLGQWLAAGGPVAYRRLSVLLELVRRGIVRGHGRLVLVSADCEEIVRWIAVISYSLPWDAVTRLSFVTYSGDPASTAQQIVGTTPDVWIPADVDATVVALEGEPEPIETGRFAETVRDLWRTMDLDGIDELAGFGAADPDTAAALVALCLAGAPLSAREQEAVAELVGKDVPGWVWSPLGERADLLGPRLAAAVAAHGPAEAAGPCAARYALLALRDPALPPPPWALPQAYRPRVSAAARAELAALARAGEGTSAAAPERDAVELLGRLVGVLRVAEAAGLELPGAGVEQAAAAVVGAGLTGVPDQVRRTPIRWREPLLAGLLTGLEQATPAVRARVLAPDLCRALSGRDLRAAPATATAVITWEVESGLLGRARATASYLSLNHPPGTAAERADVLKAIWRDPPTAAEIRGLVAEAAAQVPEYHDLSGLPARLFVREGLDSPDTVAIARLVRQARLSGFVAHDAEAVLLAADLAAVAAPGHAATEVERLTSLLAEVDPRLADLARNQAAKTLAGHDPLFRTTLLRLLSVPARQWLTGRWLAARANRDEQSALLEIAIRLQARGVAVAELERWAHSVVHGRATFVSLDGRFRKDPELAQGLRELAKGRRRGILRRGEG